MENKVKIVIVDDHALVAEAWSILLKAVDNFEVIGRAECQSEVEHLCHTFRPDIVLMDVNLKDGENGIDITRKLTNEIPRLKVIGLSMHNDISLVKKFIASGAKGYLSKGDPSEELIKAIQEVYKGSIYISSSIKDKLMLASFDDSPAEMTARELEIVKFTAMGLTSKEISEKLFISPRTVETHRHNILKKFDLHNTAQLIAWAKEKGYV